jgi:Fic family protein
MLEGVRKSCADALVQVDAIKKLMHETKQEYKSKATKIYRKELLELLFDQPYCTTRFVVERGIAKRQTAAKYLQMLTEVGLLKSLRIGKESVYINHRFLDLLSQPPEVK